MAQVLRNQGAKVFALVPSKALPVSDYLESALSQTEPTAQEFLDEIKSRNIGPAELMVSSAYPTKLQEAQEYATTLVRDEANKIMMTEAVVAPYTGDFDQVLGCLFRSIANGL